MGRRGNNDTKMHPFGLDLGVAPNFPRNVKAPFSLRFLMQKWHPERFFQPEAKKKRKKMYTKIFLEMTRRSFHYVSLCKNGILNAFFSLKRKNAKKTVYTKIFLEMTRRSFHYVSLCKNGIPN